MLRLLGKRVLWWAPYLSKPMLPASLSTQPLHRLIWGISILTGDTGQEHHLSNISELPVQNTCEYVTWEKIRLLPKDSAIQTPKYRQESWRHLSTTPYQKLALNTKCDVQVCLWNLMGASRKKSQSKRRRLENHEITGLSPCFATFWIWNSSVIDLEIPEIICTRYPEYQFFIIILLYLIQSSDGC